MKHLIIILGLFYSTTTNACKCRESPFLLDEEQYESYEGIIMGKVVGTEECNGWINYTVLVLKVYKGNFTTTLITVASANNSCLLELKEGYDYIIYGTVHSNQINSNFCTRTICLNEDYQYLDKEIEKQMRARIKADLDFLERKLK